MDFDDDDIGNFGLPPLNRNTTNNRQNKSSRLSRSKKRVRGAKTVPKKCAQKNDNHMNQQPHRRCNVAKNSSGRTMNNDSASNKSDSSSSDDDDEIALSDLAPPPRKLQNSSSSSRRAVVTPAASFFSNKPTLQRSRSNHSKREGRNNKKNESRNGEGQNRKKLKRQIGLDSFLQDNKKRQSTKINTTPVTNNSKAEVDTNQLLSTEHVKDRNHSSSSFVTASSLLGGNATNNEEVAGKDNTSSMLQDQRNDEEEEVVHASCKAATSSSAAVDEIDEFDDDLKDPTNGKEENSSNNHHPERFGIHSLILGHGLPIMHPEEYYRAASTASTDFTLADTTLSQQAGGVVERKQQQQNSPINNRNILSHLLQRTYCPKSSSTTSNLLTRYIHSSTTNQSSSSTTNESVQLSSSSSSNNNSETCAMAFDTMGILLAMGDNRGKIDIFDFDEVYSADLNKRNEWSRHCYEYQVGTAASVGQDRDDDHGDDIEESDSTTDTNHGDDAEEGGAENTGEDLGNDMAVVPPLPPTKVNPVHSFQCQFIRGNATRNNNYLNSANRPRISGIYWNPDNQDHLAVSFENKSEIHLYDVASSKVPPPCLRVGESSSRGANGMGRQQQHRCEGVLSMRFIHSPANKNGKSSLSGSTQIITGGVFGSVRLWSIPSTKLVGKRRRRCCISEVNAKCIWSMPVFGSSGDGVSDMLILPLHTTSISATTSTATTTKPLILLSGSASSTLVLLDTNKCTRKAFSTSITPTVAASWNLHQLAARELAKIDAKACIPDRRWMSVRNMRLIEYRRLTEEDGSWWCKIGMVTNAGWVFVAELVWKKNNPRLSICIVHHTPRIQCFNSSNERLAILGGMALQYSLPNAPVPSSDCVRMLSNNMIWVADVKGKKYTMPSKDKYVLCEDHNTLEVLEDEVVSRGTISESSSENGMILVSLDTVNQYDGISPATRNVVTRLSLSSSTRAPLALEIHPSGEWMVAGFGKDDSTGLKLIRLS